MARRVTGTGQEYAVNWIAIVFAAAGPPAFALVISPALTRRARGAWWWRPMPRGADWALGAASWCTGFVIGGDWTPAAISAAHVAFGLWLWWRDRRKGRRNAVGIAGYKAKAILAALARKARETAWPRPVLRPAPGGAR